MFQFPDYSLITYLLNIEETRFSETLVGGGDFVWTTRSLELNDLRMSLVVKRVTTRTIGRDFAYTI